MTRTGERVVESRWRTPSWVARIHRTEGSVIGAGVLLSPDRVLTAAHVVSPGQRYVVHFVGAPGVPAVDAAVDEEAYVPEDMDSFGDRSGDLALLRLAVPRPADHPTRLFRLAAPPAGVEMYGFPEGDDVGRWYSAAPLGGRGRDSRVQLRPHTPQELASPGFSGAGVVDLATGQVLGIVLSADEGHEANFTHMSPTETVLSHLPQVADWTDGPSAVDPQLRPGAAAGRLDVPFATELATWFGGRGRPVLVSVVPADGDRAWNLQRAIALATRELRTTQQTSRFAGDPPHTVPPPGGHDLALAVRGMTVRQITDRLAERLGVRTDPVVPFPDRLGTLRLTPAAVLVGVDESAEPGPLLGMLGQLAAQGARLLLVFRSPEGLAAQAEETLVRRPLLERRARLRRALDAIVDRLGPGLDQRLSRVRPGPDPADTELVDRAMQGVWLTGMLREQLTGTRDGEPEAAGVDALLRHEATAERRRRRLERATEHLDARLVRLHELRLRLTAEWGLWRQKAGPAGAGPDLTAYGLYESAAALLREAPCDIEAAETAVAAFAEHCSKQPDPSRSAHDSEGEGPS
ncbi:trypsin-like peptidase domain-containing protein [Streptomyces sp. NPDC006012]|uniref:trypsin-like peptidase domain-containing protein n=1 Tax=Streptomyces sp. NPDC006012 TaxID=3364739 RepID=UPI003679803C